MIDSIVTFSCGVLIGAAGMFIANTMSQIWKDRRNPAPKSYDMQSVMIELGMVSKIRRCLYKWSVRYAGSDHSRKDLAITNDLIQWIDEQLLNQ